MSDKIDRRSGEPGSSPVDPLPRAWLPERMPPEGHTFWETRAARILGAAELECARRTSHAREDSAAWLFEMGRWLKPAAALTAASLVLLFVLPDTSARPVTRHAADEMALGLVASHGDPAALWASLGVPADPVLALLTLEDHSAYVAGAHTVAPSSGENR
jgi:hypothetical protein